MEPGEQIHHFDYVVSSRGQMKFLHIFCFFFFYCGSLTSMDLLKTRWMWSEMDDRRALRGGFVEASIGELVERMSDLKRSEWHWTGKQPGDQGIMNRETWDVGREWVVSRKSRVQQRNKNEGQRPKAKGKHRKRKKKKKENGKEKDKKESSHSRESKKFRMCWYWLQLKPTALGAIGAILVFFLSDLSIYRWLDIYNYIQHWI